MGLSVQIKEQEKQLSFPGKGSERCRTCKTWDDYTTGKQNVWAQINPGLLKRCLSLMYIELVSRACRIVAARHPIVCCNKETVTSAISCKVQIEMVFLPAAPAYIVIFSRTAILLDFLFYQSNTYFSICIALTNNPCVVFEVCVLSQYSCTQLAVSFNESRCQFFHHIPTTKPVPCHHRGK